MKTKLKFRLRLRLKLIPLIAAFMLFQPIVNVAQESKKPRSEALEKILRRLQGLKFSGDFRFRFEHDWDSKNSLSTSNEGTGKREDRTRLRYRLRFGFTFDWNKHIRFGARLRTGVPSSLQSPHVNFGYQGFGMVPFNLDKIYLQGRYKNYWVWVGKNGFPFWRQNELFWDDDVTPEGIALGATFKKGNLKIKPTIGYFMANNIPVDGNNNSPFNGGGRGYGNGDNFGDMVGGQIMAEHGNENYSGIVAVGFHNLRDIFVVSEPVYSATGSQGEYETLDYQFLTASLKYTHYVGKWSFSVGYDFVNNFSDYSDVDIIQDHLKDQKTSHIASVSINKKREKGNMRFTYFYAWKEMYSVVSYYTEDDWVRWGNIHANRNTNFGGHELRLLYTFGKRLNLMARYYFVEGLVLRRATDDQLETGNRFRLDLNIKFG